MRAEAVTRSSTVAEHTSLLALDDVSADAPGRSEGSRA
jgi:hypothetical protein